MNAVEKVDKKCIYLDFHNERFALFFVASKDCEGNTGDGLLVRFDSKTGEIPPENPAISSDSSLFSSSPESVWMACVGFKSENLFPSRNRE